MFKKIPFCFIFFQIHLTIGVSIYLTFYLLSPPVSTSYHLSSLFLPPLHLPCLSPPFPFHFPLFFICTFPPAPCSMWTGAGADRTNQYRDASPEGCGTLDGSALEYTIWANVLCWKHHQRILDHHSSSLYRGMLSIC